MKTTIYSAINKNTGIREKSSSGAVFCELARWVIEQGGVVFGAKFNNQWNVVHGHTETLGGISDFLGSKYVQSSMGNEFEKVQKYLKTDRYVLFSGTPCQIEGLKVFLGKSYEKLITVDFICHGVPSPSVWRKYIAEVSKGRKISSISFRDKTDGWLKFSLNVKFADGSNYRQNQLNDLFMKGFLQDIYLRPSCYECRFKGIERDSDITLADFWGVQEILPEMFDDKGTSLVLIHSNRGKIIWDSIKKGFNFCKVQPKDAIAHNQNAIISVSLTDKRSAFYQSGNFKELNKLTKQPLRKWIKKKVKRWIKSVRNKMERI